MWSETVHDNQNNIIHLSHILKYLHCVTLDCKMVKHQ